MFLTVHKIADYMCLVQCRLCLFFHCNKIVECVLIFCLLNYMCVLDCSLGLVFDCSLNYNFYVFFREEERNMQSGAGGAETSRPPHRPHLGTGRSGRMMSQSIIVIIMT